MFAALAFIFYACHSSPASQNCEHNGSILSIGESFFHSDGCNSCTCMQKDSETMISCTELECSSTESACFELSIDECDEVSSCTVIYATPILINEDEHCYQPDNLIESVGCMEADQMCTDHTSFAALSTADQCYQFSNDCVPEEWSECDLSSLVACD